LLRCVQPTGSAACGRPVAFDGATAACTGCGTRYQVVRGVPVLKQEADPEAERHYDWLNTTTTRAAQQRAQHMSEYIQQTTRFIEEHGVRGPVLEVGCGLGLLADLAPRYVGLEYCLSALLAEGFGHPARVCGDARHLPFAGAGFQLVVSINVLEHVDRVDRAFAEIDRVLRPGGFLLLKPAWHCTRYNTELIPLRRYGELTLRQKAVKALLPVLRSRAWKLGTKVPWRLWRRLTARRANPLAWRPLTPHYGPEWIADADAAASIDCHEGILYYETRGYRCLSHSRRLDRILAGHDMVILQKP
jgi:SAM-dependent methyltransferase